MIKSRTGSYLVFDRNTGIFSVGEFLDQPRVQFYIDRAAAGVLAEIINHTIYNTTSHVFEDFTIKSVDGEEIEMGDYKIDMELVTDIEGNKYLSLRLKEDDDESHFSYKFFDYKYNLSSILDLISRLRVYSISK